MGRPFDFAPCKGRNFDTIKLFRFLRSVWLRATFTSRSLFEWVNPPPTVKNPLNDVSTSARMFAGLLKDFLKEMLNITLREH